MHVEWLDPKGSPTVVSQSELPSTLPTTVYAVGKPGVTDAQILPFDTNEGGMDGFMYLSPQSTPLPHSWGWSFNVPPSDPNVTSFVQKLKASGLVQVQSVVVF